MSNALGDVSKHDGAVAAPALRPDRLILAFDGDSGLRAMLLDVIKKAAGREDCPLCEIVYSPIGKRSAWVDCAARLQLPIAEIHRDVLPNDWGLQRSELPCVLAQTGDSIPKVLVAREAIVRCAGEVALLERTIQDALSATSNR